MTKNKPNYKRFYDDSAEMAKRTQFAQRFKPYTPPPGVIGNHASVSDCTLATDRITDFAFSSPADVIHNWLQDGLGFQGYPRLAEMAQHSEFRIPADVLASECVREWIKLTTHQGDSDDPEMDEKRSKRISDIIDEFRRLNIRQIAQEFLYDGLIYGIGHVYIDLDTANPEEKLILDAHNVKKGSLKAIKRIEAIWTYPNNYNASNPLAYNWYKPDSWWVSSIEIDDSRLIHNVPFPVSDMLKPAFNFGGLSLSQQLLPYVRNFLSIRDSVCAVTNNFSKLIIKTDMLSQMANPDFGVNEILGRLDLMEKISTGQGKVLLDKDNEDLSIVATPLSGLQDILQQSMEAQAGVARMPLVKRFGITPAGLNASSAGEIQCWYDNVTSHQESHLRPFLEKILHIVQLSLFGDVDEAITFEFEPLEQLDLKEMAEIAALKAQTDQINTEIGAVSPQEARERLIHDPTSIYAGIELENDAPAPSSTSSDDEDGGGVEDSRPFFM